MAKSEKGTSRLPFLHFPRMGVRLCPPILSTGVHFDPPLLPFTHLLGVILSIHFLHFSPIKKSALRINRQPASSGFCYDTPAMQVTCFNLTVAAITVRQEWETTPKRSLSANRDAREVRGDPESRYVVAGKPTTRGRLQSPSDRRRPPCERGASP